MAEIDNSSKQKGVLMVVLAAVLWGTLGPTIRGLTAVGAAPVPIGFWRALLAGIALAVWLALRDPAQLRVAWRDLPFFLAYGLISVALFYTVYPLAIQLSTVAVAAVLLYTAPAWVTLMSFFFFGEPLTVRKGIAVALTFAGAALVSGAYELSVLRTSGWGIAAGLASGLTYATFSIFGKAALRRYRPATTMLYSLGAGMLFLLPVALAQWQALVAPLQSAQGILLLLYIGLVPTVGSLMLYTTGLQTLNDAGRASIIATIEPLVAALLGYFLLAEALTRPQWLGGAFILAGVLLLRKE
ncbi:MAG: EamA family transporter [Ardenticatenales bacterium]|nr:EamA family transporter [Ardenticatenales bacterium]